MSRQSIQDLVLLTVIELAQNLLLETKIRIGPMPQKNGVGIDVASAPHLTTFSDKSTIVELTIALNAKNENQKIASEWIGVIQEGLSARRSYPSTEVFQILNIETGNGASYLGREADGQWLYGSSLKVRYYKK